MAGEAAASPAVRRPGAAHGLDVELGAVPRRPGGLWGSGEAAAGARRSRANAGARGRSARGGRAHDARGSAAVAAGLVARAAGKRLAPWAGGCGGLPILDTRGRASRWRLRPRFDPVCHFEDRDNRVLSLRIKESLGKFCIVYNKNVNPQMEYKAYTIDSEAFTPSLKSLKWTLPLRIQDGSPLWGNEENGLMQECCDITQPT